jgi:hypothetical protein
MSNNGKTPTSHFKLVTILLTCLVMTALGELGLRVFTDFPISELSNRSPDPLLGYRLARSMNDVDQNGFRNADQDYEVAAIGDSHTYGNNANSEQSWPKQFQKLAGAKTYNFGVGSYGVASYHMLLVGSLNDKAKVAIVALYPENDFLPKWSFCDIDFGRKEWVKEEAILGTNLKPIASGCESGKIRKASWSKWLTQKLATASAVQTLVIKPLSRRFSGKTVLLEFPNGLPAIARRSDVPRGNLGTNISDTAQLVNAFQSMAANWKKKWPGRVGVMIIPSRERVYYEILEQDGLLQAADSQFLQSTRAEIKMQQIASNALTDAGIETVSTLPYLVAGQRKAMFEKSSLYGVDDGHPLAPGYLLYAQAALELYTRMKGASP